MKKLLYGVALAAFAFVGQAQAVPRFKEVVIQLDARVTSVTGGGAVIDAAGNSRPFTVDEIPNFLYHVGDPLQVRWTLTRAELNAIYGPFYTPWNGEEPEAGVEYQLCGMTRGELFGGDCEGDRPDFLTYRSMLDMMDNAENPDSRGPVVNLLTGAVTLQYLVSELWTLTQFPYTYDPETDGFLNITSGLIAPPVDAEVNTGATGSFGPGGGTLTHFFAVQAPGDNRLWPSWMGEATINFDTHWSVHVVPEPAALGLLGLGFLGIACLRRRKA